VVLDLNVGNPDKNIAVKTKRRRCNIMKCNVEQFVGLCFGQDVTGVSILYKAEKRLQFSPIRILWQTCEMTAAGTCGA
jgi:hypothetical protein